MKGQPKPNDSSLWVVRQVVDGVGANGGSASDGRAPFCLPRYRALGLVDGDVGQVPIQLAKVQAIANHKFIGY